MKQMLSKYCKILKQNKRDFTIIILISLFVLLLYSGVVQQGLCQFKEILIIGAKNISNHIDSVMTAITFILAIFIGFGAWRKKWEESLPKKLTVHFKYEDRYVLTCYKTYLLGESDIRSWGQSVGRQMCDKSADLSFYPFIEQKNKISDDNEYKIYEVTFFLKEDIGEHLDGGKYKFWYDNEIKTSFVNKTVSCKKEIKKPFSEYIDVIEDVQTFLKKYNKENNTTLTEEDINYL